MNLVSLVGQSFYKSVEQSGHSQLIVYTLVNGVIDGGASLWYCGNDGRCGGALFLYQGV